MGDVDDAAQLLTVTDGGTLPSVGDVEDASTNVVVVVVVITSLDVLVVVTFATVSGPQLPLLL